MSSLQIIRPTLVYCMWGIRGNQDHTELQTYTHTRKATWGLDEEIRTIFPRLFQFPCICKEQHVTWSWLLLNKLCSHWPFHMFGKKDETDMLYPATLRRKYKTLNDWELHVFFYMQGLTCFLITFLDNVDRGKVYSHAMYLYFQDLDIDGKGKVVPVLN
jgi:hypothetical protein